jgi:hypothetical protein
MGRTFAYLVSCFLASSAIALYAGPREAAPVETKISGGNLVTCNSYYNGNTNCGGPLSCTDTFPTIVGSPPPDEIYVSGVNINAFWCNDPNFPTCTSRNPPNINNACSSN